MVSQLLTNKDGCFSWLIEPPLRPGSHIYPALDRRGHKAHWIHSSEMVGDAGKMERSWAMTELQDQSHVGDPTV